MKLNIKKIVGNIILISAILLIVGRFLTISIGAPFPINVVESGSMEPALYRGDIIPWMPSDINSVKAGDVIVFKTSSSLSNNERLIVHRVVEIQEERNGEIRFITQGDANNYTDQAGPHIPLPPVSRSMFMGRTISLGPQPFKIPFVGYFLLWSQDAFEILTNHINFGTPQDSIHYGVFIPLGLTAAILVAGFIIWAPKYKQSEEEELDETIFGPGRITFKRVLSYSIILYVGFLMMTYAFAFDAVSTSIGVEQPAESSRLNFGQLQQNGTKTEKLPVVNPSLFPSKCVIYPRGAITSYLDIQQNQSIFGINTGGRKESNITASIPHGTAPGSYSGEIMVYSSPYWFLLPYSFMHAIYEWNPGYSVIIFDLISALILAVATALLMLFLSWAIEEYIIQRALISKKALRVHPRFILLYNIGNRITKIRDNLKQKGSKLSTWLPITNIGWKDFNPTKPFLISLTALLFAPILLYNTTGNFVVTALLASFTTGTLTYLFISKWRAEIIFSSLLSTVWIITIFAIGSFMHLSNMNQSLVSLATSASITFGILLILFLILIIPVSIIGWLPGLIMQTASERKNPLIMLKESDM
jgi:signal peptidase I